MKRFLIVLAVVLGTSVSAQEIGSEIPVAPAPGPGGQGPGVPYVPAPPPQLSAKPFSFGIRASIIGNGLIGAPSSTAGTAGDVVPTVGVKLLVANVLAVTIDFGVALGLSAYGGGAIGFTAGGGVDILFRTEKDALRPVISASAMIAKGFSAYFGDLTFGAQAGGGAEYFFDKHFSMMVRAMFGFMINVGSSSVTSGIVVLGTFTPGVVATVYF